jgi:hypothetical protein
MTTTLGQLPVGQEFRLYKRTRDGRWATPFRWVRKDRVNVRNFADCRLVVTREHGGQAFVSVGVLMDNGEILCIVPMCADLKINVG